LRVTHTGAKTFCVRKRVKSGPPIRETLGRFNPNKAGSLTIEQARTKAKIIIGKLSAGDNVTETRRALKQELTFSALFDEFVKRHAKKIRTVSDYEQRYQQYLAKPLGKKRLSEITRQDLGGIHSTITNQGHAATANKVLAIASSVFSKGIEWGHMETNPATNIKRNSIKSRKRFLLPGELPRFFAALAEETNETIRDYFVLSILTGARRSNVLEMRWRDINLDEAMWHIPRTKNGEPQDVTLSPEAVEILTNRDEAKDKGAQFVFPSTGKSGHLVEPKAGWQRLFDRDELAQLIQLINDAGGAFEPVRDEQGNETETLNQKLTRARKLAHSLKLETDGLRIEDLRIHDLRRTLGSWQARTGASLTIIGKSLNHKSIQSTAVYARLDTDPVRQSVNTATAAIMEAAGIKKTGEIKKLRGSNA
jgi:integrase